MRDAISPQRTASARRLSIPLSRCSSRSGGRSPRRWRALAVRAVSGVLTAIHLAIWALTGFGYLWPIWPALSLGAAFGFHAMLSLMAERRTNAAIARALVVTPGAVEKHISNIFSKLDLPASDDDHRRVLAVLAFLQASG